jgi:hypothetical protein
MMNGKIEIPPTLEDLESTEGMNEWDENEPWSTMYTDVQQFNHDYYMRKIDKRIFELQQKRLREDKRNILDQTLSDTEQERLRLRLNIAKEKHSISFDRQLDMRMYWRGIRNRYKKHGMDDFLPQNDDERLLDLRRRVLHRTEKARQQTRRDSGKMDGASFDDERDLPKVNSAIDDFQPDPERDEINDATYRRKVVFGRDGRPEVSDETYNTEDMDPDGGVLTTSDVDKAYGPFGYDLPPDEFDRRLMWWYQQPEITDTELEGKTNPLDELLPPNWPRKEDIEFHYGPYAPLYARQQERINDARLTKLRKKYFYHYKEEKDNHLLSDNEYLARTWVDAHSPDEWKQLRKDVRMRMAALQPPPDPRDAGLHTINMPEQIKSLLRARGDWDLIMSEDKERDSDGYTLSDEADLREYRVKKIRAHFDIKRRQAEEAGVQYDPMQENDLISIVMEGHENDIDPEFENRKNNFRFGKFAKRRYIYAEGSGGGGGKDRSKIIGEHNNPIFVDDKGKWDPSDPYWKLSVKYMSLYPQDPDIPRLYLERQNEEDEIRRSARPLHLRRRIRKARKAHFLEQMEDKLTRFQRADIGSDDSDFEYFMSTSPQDYGRAVILNENQLDTIHELKKQSAKKRKQIRKEWDRVRDLSTDEEFEEIDNEIFEFQHKQYFDVPDSVKLLRIRKHAPWLALGFREFLKIKHGETFDQENDTWYAQYFPILNLEGQPRNPEEYQIYLDILNAAKKDRHSSRNRRKRDKKRLQVELSGGKLTPFDLSADDELPTEERMVEELREAHKRRQEAEEKKKAEFFAQGKEYLTQLERLEMEAKRELELNGGVAPSDDFRLEPDELDGLLKQAYEDDFSESMSTDVDAYPIHTGEHFWRNDHYKISNLQREYEAILNENDAKKIDIEYHIDNDDSGTDLREDIDQEFAQAHGINKPDLNEIYEKRIKKNTAKTIKKIETERKRLEYRQSAINLRKELFGGSDGRGTLNMGLLDVEERLRQAQKLLYSMDKPKRPIGKTDRFETDSDDPDYVDRSIRVRLLEKKAQILRREDRQAKGVRSPFREYEAKRKKDVQNEVFKPKTREQEREELIQAWENGKVHGLNTVLPKHRRGEIMFDSDYDNSDVPTEDLYVKEMEKDDFDNIQQDDIHFRNMLEHSMDDDMIADPFLRPGPTNWTLRWPRGSPPIPPNQPPGLVPYAEPYTDWTELEGMPHWSEKDFAHLPADKIYQPSASEHEPSTYGDNSDNWPEDRFWKMNSKPGYEEYKEWDTSTETEYMEYIMDPDDPLYLTPHPGRMSRGKVEIPKTPEEMGMYRAEYVGLEEVLLPGYIMQQERHPGVTPDAFNEIIQSRHKLIETDQYDRSGMLDMAWSIGRHANPKLRPDPILFVSDKNYHRRHTIDFSRYTTPRNTETFSGTTTQRQEWARMLAGKDDYWNIEREFKRFTEFEKNEIYNDPKELQRRTEMYKKRQEIYTKSGGKRITKGNQGIAPMVDLIGEEEQRREDHADYLANPDTRWYKQDRSDPILGDVYYSDSELSAFEREWEDSQKMFDKFKTHRQKEARRKFELSRELDPAYRIWFETIGPYNLTKNDFNEMYGYDPNDPEFLLHSKGYIKDGKLPKPDLSTELWDPHWKYENAQNVVDFDPQAVIDAQNDPKSKLSKSLQQLEKTRLENIRKKVGFVRDSENDNNANSDDIDLSELVKNHFDDPDDPQPDQPKTPNTRDPNSTWPSYDKYRVHTTDQLSFDTIGGQTYKIDRLPPRTGLQRVKDQLFARAALDQRGTQSKVTWNKMYQNWEQGSKREQVDTRKIPPQPNNWPKDIPFPPVGYNTREIPVRFFDDMQQYTEMMAFFRQEERNGKMQKEQTARGQAESQANYESNQAWAAKQAKKANKPSMNDFDTFRYNYGAGAGQHVGSGTDDDGGSLNSSKRPRYDPNRPGQSPRY